MRRLRWKHLPGNWRGTSCAFVLHWKEQISHYEKLEMEAFRQNRSWHQRACSRVYVTYT
jgi:hypothetical protein